MTLTDQPSTGGGQVAFVAANPLIDAIDAAAARLGVTRSHYVRARIAEYLKSEGFLAPDAPSSKHEAKYRPKNY